MDIQAVLLQNLFRLSGIIKSESIVFNLEDPKKVSVIAMSLDRGDAIIIQFKHVFELENMESFSFNFLSLQKFVQGLERTETIQLKIQNNGVLVLQGSMGTRTVRLNAFSKDILRIDEIVARFEIPVDVQIKRDILERQIMTALEVEPTTFRLHSSKNNPSYLEVQGRKIDQTYVGQLPLIQVKKFADLECVFTRAPFLAIKLLPAPVLDLRMSREHLELAFEDEMFIVRYFDRTLMGE